jgi:hypothetical protein
VGIFYLVGRDGFSKIVFVGNSKLGKAGLAEQIASPSQIVIMPL